MFSSKGGTGKSFLTTNLASAIAELTGQDTAVVDLDFDMGDVFTYFGSEPSSNIPDLMGLGEGATHDHIRSVGVPMADHLWAYGAPLDPAAEAPAGEVIGKFLRALRNDFPWVVVDASVDYSDSALVCFDLSDTICLVTGPRRRGSEAPVQGARHVAGHRPAARPLPRGAEPRRQQGRAGLGGRRARPEDPGRRHDPVQPPRADVR